MCGIKLFLLNEFITLNEYITTNMLLFTFFVFVVEVLLNALGYRSRSIMNSITVLSANCRGLQNMRKRVDVLTRQKELNHNIVCLQDTHWTNKDMALVSEIWGCKCYIHGTRTDARGGAKLLKD